MSWDGLVNIDEVNFCAMCLCAKVNTIIHLPLGIMFVTLATNGDMAAWVATLIFRRRRRSRKICFGDPDFAKVREGRQNDF
jgi:hypothetical protein